MGMQKTTPLCNRVQTLLSEALGVPSTEILPDTAFGDLPQWDSMGHMEVMMLLEEHFEIEINADTIAELTSLPAICVYLQENGHDEV